MKVYWAPSGFVWSYDLEAIYKYVCSRMYRWLEKQEHWS